SWVSGRPSALPEILVAMAWASKEPIQIGRYRSASFSLRITRCWAVGMWMRMLSTDTSMRFFILGSILAFGPPHPLYMNACGAPEARSGGSGDRFGDPGGPDPGEAPSSGASASVDA